MRHLKNAYCEGIGHCDKMLSDTQLEIFCMKLCEALCRHPQLDMSLIIKIKRKHDLINKVEGLLIIKMLKILMKPLKSKTVFITNVFHH